ncbi:Beta-lactamase-like protein 2 [Hypsibius exemplaris]|uniref:Beta-lactamase-like protein 2 homolog n=1 Tax=Hypsibius exemplaris TaxID=2072580 RepID=A0A1W0WKL2_HYPEX|nr:Beta-lactamase-like protein 2 [Hypsibius exemplaris]
MGGAESRLARIIAWRLMGTPAGLKPIPPVSRLSANVVRVLGCNPGPMTLQGTNTYILGTGSERILIDTGEQGNTEYLTNLKAVLAEDKARISQIVLTHWHADHIGGLAGVLSAGCTTERPKVRKFRRAEDDRTAALRAVDHFEDGDRLTVDGATIRAVYSPGHTVDHISLFLEDNSALFSGDCILGEGSSVFENYPTYMKSLAKLHSLKPVVIYPAHGSVLENGSDAIEKYINHRLQRETEILAALQKAYPGESTVDELVALIYPKLNMVIRRAAAGNVVHQLEKLIDEGRVENCGEDRYRLIQQSSPTT